MTADFRDVLDNALGEFVERFDEASCARRERAIDEIKRRLVEAHETALDEAPEDGRDEILADLFDAKEENRALRDERRRLREQLAEIETRPSTGPAVRALRAAGELPWL